MQTLNPALALVEYKKDNVSVRKLTPVAADDCEPRCELSDPDEWTIYSHMRAKEEEYPQAKDYFLQLVLKLEPGAGTQEAGAYHVSVSSVGGGADMSMAPYRAPDGACYFIPPRANDNVKSAGRQEIRIEYTGRSYEIRTVQVYILPSSVDDEDYRLMLEDIARLHQKLLIGPQSAGTVSVGQRWEGVTASLERDIEQMRQILRQLETAPDQDLVAVQSRVPSYKLKKMTAKAIVDRETGRRLVRTSLHTDSLDIYEHRMIRTYLEKLRRQVLQYQKIEEGERTNLAGEAVSQDELDRARTHLQKKLQEMLVQMREPIPRHPGGCRDLLFRVSGIPDIRSHYNSCTIKCFPSKKPEGAAWQPVFSPWNSDTGDRWFNQMFLPSGRGIWQYWFLLHCMRELIQFWETSPQPSREPVTFRMSCIQEPMEDSGSGHRKYRIVINYLECMTLPGRPPVQFQEFADSLRSVRGEKDLIRCITEGKLPSCADEDDLFYSASLIGQAEYRSALLNGRCGWEGITGQIDQLLASPVLRVRPRKGEQLHASNLFTCHRLYRRAYALMRQRREQFSAIDLWSGRSAPVGATHHIYEIWCLLQMLSIWIQDYSFTLESHTVKELAGELLRRTDTGAVGPIRLVKKSGALAGLTLELEYNQTFEYQDKKDGQRKELRPDYCLTVSYRWKTCRFFMDAKYKNFSEKQMGIEAWYGDLYDVALRKYLFCLDETCSGSTGKTVKTSGSYILHADAREHRPESGWDPREFFWYKSDTGRSNLDPVSSSVLQKVRLKSPGLLDCIGEQSGGNVESLRFGSICFTPRTNGRFRILMQMIMEHFLGGDFPELYLQKCWICGSEDVKSEPRYTARGSRKYYITCQHCRRFWVQTVCINCGRLLGKHRNNYYRVKPKTVWNVICPDCESSLYGTDRGVPLEGSAERAPF